MLDDFYPDPWTTNITVQGSSSSVIGMTWDGMGRMRTASNPAGAGQNEQIYTYDTNGLRAQVLDTDPARSRRYAYTSGGQLLSEYIASSPTYSKWNRDVIYLGGQAIAEIEMFRGEDVIHELHCDYQGTPMVITSNGQLEGTQSFQPFGAGPANTGYMPLTGYTGHLQADATGLIYMRGRYFSPAWRRFVSPDGNKDPGSPNQYAYVLGNPFGGRDPSGWNTEERAKYRLWFWESDAYQHEDAYQADGLIGIASRHGLQTVVYTGQTYEMDNSVGKDVNWRISNFLGSRNSSISAQDVQRFTSTVPMGPTSQAERNAGNKVAAGVNVGIAWYNYVMSQNWAGGGGGSQPNQGPANHKKNYGKWWQLTKGRYKDTHEGLGIPTPISGLKSAGSWAWTAAKAHATLTSWGMYGSEWTATSTLVDFTGLTSGTALIAQVATAAAVATACAAAFEIGVGISSAAGGLGDMIGE